VFSLNSFAWLVGLFFLGLIPRVVIVAASPTGIEFWEYETLARNIADGQGYVIARFGHVARAFGDGNLYSFVAATVYVALGHNALVLVVVQAVLASLAAPVIFAIGEQTLGRPAAALGAALAALHPGLLAYTLKLHPLGLDVVLMSLLVLRIVNERGRMRDGLLVGFTLGMNLMSRPTFFVAGVAGLGVRWLRTRHHLAPTLLAVLVALLIAAPWVARNWAVLGRPLLISTSLEDVWKGNNPIASGSSFLPSGEEIFAAAPAELMARFLQADELELNELFGREITAFVTEHPVDFVALVARKFVYFWWLSPQAGMLYPPSWLAAYEVYAAIILGLAIVGATGIVRNGSAEERNLLAVLAAISLALAGVHALAYVEGRHRWGVEPLLLLLTARGILSSAAVVLNSWPADHVWFFRRARQK
jgi:hypothetical protein